MIATLLYALCKNHYTLNVNKSFDRQAMRIFKVAPIKLQYQNLIKSFSVNYVPVSYHVKLSVHA